MTSEHGTRTEEETRRVAIALGRRLRGGAVVALDGPLGAGKTAFVRGLAEGLALDPALVSSPTFILCQEYGEDEPGTSLVHIDAYRLERPEDLDALGWDELRERDDAVIAIEWAERIADALPPDTIHVTISYEGAVGDDAPTGRRILIERPSDQPRPCATCGREVAPNTEHFPFCSERCRMADLGAWFSGTYRFERPIEEQDLEN